MSLERETTINKEYLDYMNLTGDYSRLGEFFKSLLVVSLDPHRGMIL